MFDWIVKLTPGEQITLAGVVIGFVFNSGAYFATIRTLAKKVEKHDGQIQLHGEEIAALKAGQDHGRA